MVTLRAWLHDIAATNWGVNTNWITPKGTISALRNPKSTKKAGKPCG